MASSCRSSLYFARGGEGVIGAATTLVDDLRRAGVRVELDDHVDVSLGRRIVDHELRGVPIRVELGPRDLAADQVVVARRPRVHKETAALAGIAQRIPEMLAEDQRELRDQAAALRDGYTRPAQSIDDARELANEGFARLPWRACGTEGEDRLAHAGVSVRCLVREDVAPVDNPDADGVEALLARAYYSPGALRVRRVAAGRRYHWSLKLRAMFEGGADDVEPWRKVRRRRSPGVVRRRAGFGRHAVGADLRRGVGVCRLPRTVRRGADTTTSR